jgi:hypothetical protein
MDDLDDFLDPDLDVVPVIAGAITGDGYLDLNSEMIFNGNLTIIDYLLTAQTSKFGGLGYGAAISVNGETYKVEMLPQRFDDGRFCRIPLVRVDAPGPLYVILNGDPSGTTDDPAPAELPKLIFNGDP